MKRKQIVLDRLEDIDNVLVSLYQALQQPKVTKDQAEYYINVVRERLKDVDNLVRLEDHAY
jgi:hypothetical protein